jgi:RNase H-like domain found in reverse transcriptase
LLHRFTRHDAKWEWNEEYNKAFLKLKNILASPETLVHYDEQNPLIIATDASDLGIGAVLMHRF